MSLWLDSLSNSLSGYDGPPYYGPAEMKRPFFIFAHLAMQAPRSWWEPYLRRGKPRKDHVEILRDLFNDLKECPERKDGLIIVSSSQWHPWMMKRTLRLAPRLISTL
jgi:hypothetical protein